MELIENKIKKAWINYLPNNNIKVELVITKKWYPYHIDLDRVTLFNDYEETSSITYELNIPELYSKEGIYESYYSIDKNQIFIYYHFIKYKEKESFVELKYKQLIN